MCLSALEDTRKYTDPYLEISSVEEGGKYLIRWRDPGPSGTSGRKANMKDLGR